MPPQFKVELLKRNKLQEIFSKENGRKTTIITAPGGYGKTVLAKQLANSTEKPYIWYRIDENDDSAAVFFEYIFAAIGIPLNSSELEIQTDIIDKDILRKCDVAKIIALFLDKIKKLELDRLTIVFDGFHSITNKIILDFTEMLLEYLPPNIDVIITSRECVRLRLEKLRVSNVLLEWTSKDLEFSFEEVLKLAMLWNINGFDNKMFKNLYTETEGWPLAISATFYTSLNSRVNVTGSRILSILEELSYEYFTLEIFNSISDKIKEFLINTSVLETLSSEACDYIMMSDNSAEVLKTIYKMNLFVTKSTSENNTYVYHKLFKNYLCKCPQGNKKSNLLKAGQYYYENSLFSEAIDCYIKAEADDLAFLSFRVQAIESLRRGKLGTIEKGLEYFKDKRIKEKEWLYLIDGAIRLFRGMYSESEQLLKRALNIFLEKADENGTNQTLILIARMHMYMNSIDESIELVDAILEDTLEIDGIMLCDAYMQKAYALMLKGDFKKMEVLLEAGIEILRRKGDTELYLFLEKYLIIPAYVQGEFKKVFMLQEKAISTIDNEIEWREKYSLDMYIARAYRDIGELQKSKELLEKTIQKKQQIGYVDDLQAVYYHLANVYMDLGDYNTAMKYAELSLEIYRKSGGETWHPGLIYPFMGLISACQGKPQEGLLIAEHAANDLCGDSLFTMALAKFNVGLISIKVKDYEKARINLVQASEITSSIGFRQVECVCNGLLVKVYSEIGTRHAMLEVGVKCLDYAAKENYIQVFLSNPEMEECINIGILNHIHVDFIIRILNKMGEKAANLIRNLVMLEDIKFFNSEEEDKWETYMKLNQLILFQNKKSEVGQKEYSLIIVSCLGNFSAYFGQDDLKAFSWRTKKVKELFAYFIHNRGKTLTRDKILSDLWPEIENTKAQDLFYTNLSYLKNLLKSANNEGALRRTQTGYILDTSYMYCDEWMLEDIVLNEDSLVIDKIEQFKQVASLYKGEYMSDIYSNWVDENRIRLEIKFIYSVLKKAKEFISEEKFDVAERLLISLIDNTPDCSEAYKMLANIFNKTKRGYEADKYEKLLRKYEKDS